MASTLPDRRPRRPARSLPALATALAAVLMTAGCGLDGLLGGDDGAPEVEFTTPTSMSEENVRKFYAVASEAYRLRDAGQLCRMHDDSYREQVVRQAVKGGLAVDSCEDLFGILFAAEPEGYLDQLSKVKVRGNTATLLSGDDPWRIRMVDGEMRIVAPAGAGKSG